MSQTAEPPTTPTAPKKADGIFTMQIKYQTIIMELFFSYNSTQTFGDKLLRVILAEKTAFAPV